MDLVNPSNTYHSAWHSNDPTRARQNVADWQKLSVMFDYYAIERSDAEQAASLQVSLRQRGRHLPTVDALIAAIALRYDLTLLTVDQDFAEIPGLQRENWFAAAP